MSITVESEVDLDDVYDEMSRWDKKQMAEWLSNDGYCSLKISQEENGFYIENPNVLDEMYLTVMEKLFHGRLQLSNEDIEILQNIANKL